MIVGKSGKELKKIIVGDNVAEQAELTKEKRPLKKRTTETGAVIVSPTFGNFPMGKWKEWEEDCNNNYSGCRWMKAYADHNDAQHKRELETLVAAVHAKTEVEEEESEEGVTTLGGNKHT